MKYSLYATGEIILVVVGILIALQINNWNESRKNKKFEITVLENIREDIITDKLDLEINLKYAIEEFRNEGHLLKLLLAEGNYDTAKIKFVDALGMDLVVIFHRATYNNLQNNDIGIISNNKIYKKITRFYDYYISGFSEIENRNKYANTYTRKLDYFRKHFNIRVDKSPVPVSTDGNEELFKQEFERYNLEIRDKEMLISDDEFKLVLAESQLAGSVKIDMYKQIIQKIDELSMDLDDEIKRLGGNED